LTESRKVYPDSSVVADPDPGSGAFLTPGFKTLLVVCRDEWLDEKKLPIKYAGISSCFRQEVCLYLVVRY
jgi:hypothetical protein